MVGELHKVGYQRLRVVAMPLDGSSWRCGLTSAGNTLREDGLHAAYFDMSNTLIGGPHELQTLFGNEARSASARRLAELFVERFGGLPESCRGRDWAYAGWFAEVLGAAEEGHFFVQGSPESSGPGRVPVYSFPDATTPPPHLLPPPPGEAEGDPRLLAAGWASSTRAQSSASASTPLIRIPTDDADLQELDAFGISYNAYERLGTSSERLGQVVRPVLKALDTGKPLPEWAGLDLLRGALFYVHRRGHSTGPSPQLEREFRTLITRIRNLSANGTLPRDSFG